MTRAISNRLRRLERRAGPVCPACGLGGETRFEVEVPAAVGRVSELPDPAAPRRCPDCGRATEYLIALPAARGRGDDFATPRERHGEPA